MPLDPKTGLLLANNTPANIIASDSEAADIIYHDGYFYLFVNHGSCFSGDRSTYYSEFAWAVHQR